MSFSWNFESIAACCEVIERSLLQRYPIVTFRVIFFPVVLRFFLTAQHDARKTYHVKSSTRRVPSGTRDNARDVSGIDRQRTRPSPVERIVTFDKQSSLSSLPLNWWSATAHRNSNEYCLDAWPPLPPPLPLRRPRFLPASRT